VPRTASDAYGSNRWRPSAGLRIAGLVTLAAGLAGLILSAGMLGGKIEARLGQFVLFHLRGALPPPPEVVVVAVDRASAETMGLPSGSRPWPRSLHARTIEKLTARGAAVIAFDLMFSAPDLDGDDVLATALRKAGCVVLLRGLERRIVGGGSAIEIDRPIDPIPKLAEAAAAIAPFPLPKVPARVDRFWTFHGVAGEPTVPSVVLQLAAQDIAHRWTELLATEPDLPGFDLKEWTGPNLTIAMQRLHAAFRAKPETAGRLRARLQTGEWDGADKHRLAALIGLYAGEDSRYLNLRGPAGTVRTVKYASVFSDFPERPDPVFEDLSAKVVFIGVSELHSTTQADAYDTVFSALNGINVTGAEIGATAFADLAEESSPRSSVPAAIVEVLLVALLLSAAASSGRVFVLLGTGGLLVIAIVVAGWYAFVTQHVFLPLANPILFQIPVGVLTALWCMRGEERRQRERMVGAARQYLPEEVVRRLASGPLHGSSHLAGEVRHSVCLASDIEGFTTLSERLTPDAVQTLLNQYFQGMFDVMQQHGGVISDISGDGVMCVWSGPAFSSSACDGAVSAAMELLEFVRQFNLRHPDQMLPTRIGIHAGSALVGVVGGAGRYASTVVGNVANTASRIEGLNKQLSTRLLASEEVLNQVTGLILRPLGDFLLAGKSEPIRVSEVLGRIGDAHAAVLAGSFAQAFESFRSGCWDEAVALLEALLHTHPDDGPSRYFLARALSMRADPKEGLSALVSRMDKK
jgi:adenylate cyclase